MGPTPKALLFAIGDDDVAEVADYLHRELSNRVTRAQWEWAIRAPWQPDPPNHGFLLRVGDTIVGAYVAIYSQRHVRGREVPICNLAAWCVDAAHRFSSVRLLKALLAQEGYHFTDLSPSGSVVALNRRLGFADLDTATAVAVNAPWPTVPGRTTVTSDPAAIEAALAGDELRIYRDHADAPAARHLLATTPTGQCHIIYRRDRRKNLPLFATVLWVSDATVFREALPALSRHLLLRRGIPALLAETRITGCRPRLSFTLRHPRPKMFKSHELAAEDIDDLYSELVAVAW